MLGTYYHYYYYYYYIIVIINHFFYSWQAKLILSDIKNKQLVKWEELNDE